VTEAKDACKDGSAAECAAAWDVVEEISAANSHAKAKSAVRRKPWPQNRRLRTRRAAAAAGTRTRGPSRCTRRACAVAAAIRARR
jgi:hypothetical protein